MMRRGILIVLFICLLFGLVGCGYYESYDRKPDNSFSSTVKEEFGDDLYYYETSESSMGVIQYQFIIREFRTENIERIAELANDELSSQDDKISISVRLESSRGAERVFSVRNYSDASLNYPNYDKFSCLDIGYLTWDHDPFWDDVSIYYSLPNIRYLRISDRLQEYADTQGIDWHEIWPDLEEVEVYDTSNWGKG